MPATRELAGTIGLNRTTITAAYNLLEAEGLIRSHVGRGSFISGGPEAPAPVVRWHDLFVSREPEPQSYPMTSGDAPVASFATSRPAEELFPLDEMRRLLAEVMAASAVEILQLGSPGGYPPLRRYLMAEAASSGSVSAGDDVMVTSGCQQAIDLLQRVLVGAGDAVAVEDPVYPGVHHALARAGARLTGVPVGQDGLDLDRLEQVLARERPKLLIVTPDFQNPTGATLPLEARERLLRLALDAGTVVAENAIYSGLRYEGTDVPSLKQLGAGGNVIQLRSFSKVAFPGLRVGWVVGPRPVISKLVEAKQWSDLHTDQLSQALLCRFAESGRLEEHRKRVVAGGRRRLEAALAACERCLPGGVSFTRPQGGMSLWVDLPAPLDTAELLPRAAVEGVTYLPGRYFAVSRPHTGGLRLSFGGIAPERITKGISILGALFRTELGRMREPAGLDTAPAIV